ncbi:ribosomal protein L33 [Drepanopeziza brunnea f. sp. 'multigermtubi' MB_m1]|uniref:Large ribosomal subunit protein bL33m n=1 Tax=Marssonina brunnea f. sp. multigermtubi (strain MB_m1) TaxID=1072389 RepID=K1XRP2_MARBU|nr:ribosomal protein L33 [Drepanopeziza brunnea f. sp. 'multigermtubi' MB_m1]EKD15264.1 ribosomal protein L33 [Drepanopeziza brunnea f. sp. 'multigermtubi' MB_m1]
MAKKAKSRTIAVRLVSMALTGYYKTLVRPRTHRPLSMLKYDPVVMQSFDMRKRLLLRGKIVECDEWCIIGRVGIRSRSRSQTLYYTRELYYEKSLQAFREMHHLDWKSGMYNYDSANLYKSSEYNHSNW